VGRQEDRGAAGHPLFEQAPQLASADRVTDASFADGFLEALESIAG
jgi:hypothetical protein